MPSPHHTMSSRSTPLRDATNTQSYSSSTSRSFSHKPAGDAFRPQLLGLPKDPFAAKPWIVNLDVLPSSSSRIRQTILVLGTPPQSDARALVHSEALRDSLLLIATHDVKPFASFLLDPIQSEASSSPSYGPTTRILRLGSPLFPQNRVSSTTPSASRTTSSLHGVASTSTTTLPAPSSGGGSDALRVMSLLNRASQVASSLDAWTCDNGSTSTSIISSSRMSRIRQLGENPLTGEFNVFEVLGSASPLASISQSRPPSIASPQVKRSRRQTLHSFFGFGSASSSLPPSASAATASPGSSPSGDAPNTPSSPAHADIYAGLPACGNAACAGALGKSTKGGQGGGRSFDALINYLPSPSSIPEKIILKQAILTTTLSAPYLSSSALHPPLSSSKSEQKDTTDKSKKKQTRASMLGIPLSRKPTSASSSGDLRPSSRLSKRQSRAYASTIGSFPEEEPTLNNLIEALDKYSGPGHLLHVVPDSQTLFSSPSTGRSTPTRRVAHRPRDSSIPSLAKPRLVAGIEQFILAFAYPVAAALKPSASAAASISSARTTPLPSPSSSYSAASAMPFPGSASTNGALLAGELGALSPRPQSLSAILNGKPAPYIIKAGVLGETFSFCSTSDDAPRTLSIADLLLFGAVDGSIEEHGGGKAWLGGVGAREIIEELSGGGKLLGALEVRHTGVFECVWVGGLEADPKQNKRDSPKARRRSLSRTPSSSSLGAASSSSEHSADRQERNGNRPLAKVSRKPAPTLTPSDSMTAAWDALQSQAKSKPTVLEPVEDEASAAKDLEVARQEFKERKAAAVASRTRRKSASRNPSTGLLTPPGSASEKDVDLDTDSEQLVSDSTRQDTSGSSVLPPSTMEERTESSHSEESQSSAGVPTPASSRENEESFDFASCYQYDRSQCPEREQAAQDPVLAPKVTSVPPKGADLGSVRSKAPSSKYQYATAIREDGLHVGDTGSTIAQSTTASSIKKKGRLSKFLGRVLSIRGSPTESNTPRRRRLSVVHTEQA